MPECRIKYMDNSYYIGMALGGPMFGGNENDARIFESKEHAQSFMGMSSKSGMFYPLVNCVIERVGKEIED